MENFPVGIDELILYRQIAALSFPELLQRKEEILRIYSRKTFWNQYLFEHFQETHSEAQERYLACFIQESINKDELFELGMMNLPIKFEDLFARGIGSAFQFLVGAFIGKHDSFQNYFQICKTKGTWYITMEEIQFRSALYEGNIGLAKQKLEKHNKIAQWEISAEVLGTESALCMYQE